MANKTLVDRFGTEHGWRELEEANVSMLQTIAFNTLTPQSFPLAFRFTSLASAVRASYAAFMVLRRVVIQVQRPYTQRIAYPVMVPKFQTFTNNVGNGTTNVDHTVGFQGVKYIEVVLPAGVTLTSGFADTDSPVGTTPVGAITVISASLNSLDLARDYGSYGIINARPPSDANAGIKLRLVFNNSGAATNVTINVWGNNFGPDWQQFALSYQDWTKQSHVIGNYEPDTPVYENDLSGGLLVPIPILDTGMTDFGSLIFSGSDASNYNWYQGTWPASIVVTAALAYLVDD